MKNIPLLLGTIVGTLLLIVAVAFFFSQDNAEQISLEPNLVSEGGRHTFGPDDALVTVVEFSDFQCPACRAAAPQVDALKAQYPEQVQIIYRHFPLDQIHPNARLAAVASEVAAESELFWEYHDLLFENQPTWSAITERTDLVEAFASYAEELEIDKAAFLERIEASELAQHVETDRQLGNSVGVDGTPTFFVNGVRTTAPQLLPTVESILAENVVEVEDAQEVESEESAPADVDSQE